MAQRSTNSGCIVLVAILAAVGVGVILIFAIFFTKSVSMDRPEMPHPTVLHDMAGNGGEGMVFTEATRPRMSVPKPGEPVTLKVFAAYMIDDDATDLAKDSFRKVAEGAEVSWRLRLQQITDRKGVLQGDFNVPWKVREGGGSYGSSFSVNVEFDEAGRDSLLQLRRSDWVTVEGRLSLGNGGGGPTIKNAIVADTVTAEKP